MQPQNNKASGPDSVSQRMLKGVAKQSLKQLATLFNQSLAECCFPKSWNVANIVPIFRKGNKISIFNYRPVLLLSCYGNFLKE